MEEVGSNITSKLTKMKKFLIIIIICSLALFLSCNQKQELPGYVKEVIEVHSIPRIKKSLNVVLTERINEIELEVLASKIYKKIDGDSFENIFVDYYIEGMTIDNGAYARSHFTPILDLKINGLTKEESTAIIEDNLMGKRYWFDDGMRVIVTISNVDEEFYLNRYFTASRVDKEKVSLSINNSDTIYTISNSTEGVFYRTNELGELEQYDNEGFIYKMIKK